MSLRNKESDARKPRARAGTAGRTRDRALGCCRQLDQPRAVEPVDAVIFGRNGRARCADRPPSVIHSAGAPISSGRDRRRSTGAPERSSASIRSRPFLRFQRAGAVDQQCRPAAACRPPRAADSPGPPQAARRPRAFQMRHVGMAADRAGRGARRVEQHRLDRLLRTPGQRIGRDRLDRQVEPLQVGDQPIETAGRAVDRRHLGAGVASCAVLPPGAAQRSMTSQPGNIAEQSRRQRRRRILDPPGALGIAGQVGHRAARRRGATCRSAAASPASVSHHVSADRRAMSGRAAPPCRCAVAIARAASRHSARSTTATASPAC